MCIDGTKTTNLFGKFPSYADKRNERREHTRVVSEHLCRNENRIIIGNEVTCGCSFNEFLMNTNAFERKRNTKRVLY